MFSNPSPIVIFAFNRLYHLQETVKALCVNDLAPETELWIYCDGERNDNEKAKVSAVRSYCHSISGFKKVTVVEREKNYGLSRNIIEGVSELLNKYETIIVLEDDLLTSPHFLRYMNEGLQIYERDKDVISIHGYLLPIKEKMPETFFLKGADCFGWATWKNKWSYFEKDGTILLDQLNSRKLTSDFDFNSSYPYTKMLQDQINGINDSWAVRWYASAFLLNMYTLYPGRSLVFHNGGDNSGTNAGVESMLDCTLSETPVKVIWQQPTQYTPAYLAFSAFMKKMANPGLYLRIKRKASFYIKKIKRIGH